MVFLYHNDFGSGITSDFVDGSFVGWLSSADNVHDMMN